MKVNTSRKSTANQSDRTNEDRMSQDSNFGKLNNFLTKYIYFSIKVFIT
jgi:hypothetical protein